MPHDNKKLELLAGGGAAQRLWAYKSDDAKASIVAEGYFNDASGVLRVGDWMMINASDGYGLAVVNQNSGGVVDVTDLTAVGAADAT